jgi:hypothetical protein
LVILNWLSLVLLFVGCLGRGLLAIIITHFYAGKFDCCFIMIWFFRSCCRLRRSPPPTPPPPPPPPWEWHAPRILLGSRPPGPGGLGRAWRRCRSSAAAAAAAAAPVVAAPPVVIAVFRRWGCPPPRGTGGSGRPGYAPKLGRRCCADRCIEGSYGRDLATGTAVDPIAASVVDAVVAPSPISAGRGGSAATAASRFLGSRRLGWRRDGRSHCRRLRRHGSKRVDRRRRRRRSIPGWTGRRGRGRGGRWWRRRLSTLSEPWRRRRRQRLHGR